MQRGFTFPSSARFSRQLTRRTLLSAVGAAGMVRLLPSESALAETEEVGVVQPGLPAFDLIGTLDQVGMEFSTHGFLTSISGLEEPELYSGGIPIARTPDVALFTYEAAASATSRAIVNKVAQIRAAGSFAIKFDDSGVADFATPESFAGGTVIAGFDFDVTTDLTVYAPKQGILTGRCVLTQTSAETFTLGDRELTIGEVGQVFQLTLHGVGELTDPNPLAPVSSFSVAAEATTVAPASG